MRHAVWAVALAAGWTGCAQVKFLEVPRGVIETPGVQIVAEDHSFTLNAGELFKPPFFANDCLVTATPENFKLAYKMGTKPVMVTVPGREKALYGVLALCKVHPDATGPATREYLMTVPQDRVDATSGGRISVWFEELNTGATFDDGFHDYDAWQLWLSELPFI